MADLITYSRINWEDAPSEATPVNSENLNKMDKTLEEIVEVVNQHSEQKVDKQDGYSMVSDSEKQAWNNKSDFSGSYNDLTDKPFGERFEEVTLDLNEYITEWMVADQENSLIAAEVQFETDFGLYAGSKVKFVFDDKELEYTLEDISTVIGSDMIGCGDISSMMTGDLSTVNLIFMYGFIDGVGMMQIMLKGSIPTVANLISEVVVVDKLDAKFYDKSLPKVTENDNENIAMVVDGKWVAAPIDRKWRVLLDKTTTVGNQNPFFVNIDNLLGENKINEFLFQVELPDDVNNATKIKVGEVNSGLEFNMPNVNRRLSIYMSIAEGEYFNIISTYSGDLTGEGGVMFPIRISKINNTNYNYFKTAKFELYKYTDRVNIPKGARCRILGR